MLTKTIDRIHELTYSDIHYDYLHIVKGNIGKHFNIYESLEENFLRQKTLLQNVIEIDMKYDDNNVTRERTKFIDHEIDEALRLMKEKVDVRENNLEQIKELFEIINERNTIKNVEDNLLVTEADMQRLRTTVDSCLNVEHDALGLADAIGLTEQCESAQSSLKSKNRELIKKTLGLRFYEPEGEDRTDPEYLKSIKKQHNKKKKTLRDEGKISEFLQPFEDWISSTQDKYGMIVEYIDNTFSEYNISEDYGLFWRIDELLKKSKEIEKWKDAFNSHDKEYTADLAKKLAAVSEIDISHKNEELSKLVDMLDTFHFQYIFLYKILDSDKVTAFVSDYESLQGVMTRFNIDISNLPQEFKEKMQQLEEEGELFTELVSERNNIRSLYRNFFPDIDHHISQLPLDIGQIYQNTPHIIQEIETDAETLAQANLKLIEILDHTRQEMENESIADSDVLLVGSSVAEVRAREHSLAAIELLREVDSISEQFDALLERLDDALELSTFLQDLLLDTFEGVKWPGSALDQVPTGTAGTSSLVEIDKLIADRAIEVKLARSRIMANLNELESLEESLRLAESALLASHVRRMNAGALILALTGLIGFFAAIWLRRVRSKYRLGKILKVSDLGALQELLPIVIDSKNKLYLRLHAVALVDAQGLECRDGLDKFRKAAESVARRPERFERRILAAMHEVTLNAERRLARAI